MKTIYRSKKWKDGTTRIEVENGVVNFFSSTEKPQGDFGWTPIDLSTTALKFGWEIEEEK